MKMIVSLVLLRRRSRCNHAGGNNLEERNGDFDRGSSGAEEGGIADRAVPRRQHPADRAAELPECYQIRTVDASSLRRLQPSVDAAGGTPGNVRKPKARTNLK